MNLAAAIAVPASLVSLQCQPLKYPDDAQTPDEKCGVKRKALYSDPVEAWASIIEDADKAKKLLAARGRGGFVRSSRQESKRTDRRI